MAVNNTVCIKPSKIYGTLSVPPSKSAAHRALLCAALSGGGSVSGVELSQDIAATLQAAGALGVAMQTTSADGRVTVQVAPTALANDVTVDCGESGTTLRLILPLLAARGITATLHGHGRLPQRPMGVYAQALPAHGVTLTLPTDGNTLPLRLSGRLTAGDFALPGDVSSQFISGLLLALPLCEGDSVVRLTSPLQSAPYVDMTLAAQRRAGVDIDFDGQAWHIRGGQTYRPTTTTVEGDWSQAAFVLAAGALGGEVTLTGLDSTSAQGDRAIVDILRRFGARITEQAGTVTCGQAPLRGCTVDVTHIPDLAPIVAVIASQAQGVSRITGGARLRLKESDRLAAMTDVLRTLGVAVKEHPDGMTIVGNPHPTGGVCVRGHNDHRVVMSAAVAALACAQPLTITDAPAVAKSWPTFFEDFATIGGGVYAE